MEKKVLCQLCTPEEIKAVHREMRREKFCAGGRNFPGGNFELGKEKFVPSLLEAGDLKRNAAVFDDIVAGVRKARRRLLREKCKNIHEELDGV